MPDATLAQRADRALALLDAGLNDPFLRRVYAATGHILTVAADPAQQWPAEAHARAVSMLQSPTSVLGAALGIAYSVAMQPTYADLEALDDANLEALVLVYVRRALGIVEVSG